MRRSRINFTICSLMMLLISTVHHSARADDEFINMPVVVNIMTGATITEDEVKEAIKKANEIYKQAGIKLTLHKINSNVANPSGAAGSTLTRADRDKLREQGLAELPDGKGVKITIAAQPSATDDNVNGLTVHKTACSICRKTARTGETIAHEIGHILTLDDVTGEDTQGRLMHGTFGTRTGTTLTPDEIAEIKKEAEKRATKTEKKAAPEVPAESKENCVGTASNENSVVPGIPQWQDLLMVQFSRILPDPFYELRINSRGILPPENTWSYDVLFNTDANPETGEMIRGIPGIDARLTIQVVGMFGNGQFLSFNPPIAAPIPVNRIIEPEYVTVDTGQADETPGSDVFECMIPLEFLPIDATTPFIPMHVFSAPGPFSFVDLISLDVVPNQAVRPPSVTVFPPSITPEVPPTFNVFTSGLSPNTPVMLSLDDHILLEGVTDPLGNLAMTANLDDLPPEVSLSPDYYFVTVQELSPAATFAYSVIHIDSGSTPPCPPCIADYNNDGGIEGADIESFFDDWESGNACADVNFDGGIEGADVEVFFSLWSAGSCD